MTNNEKEQIRGMVWEIKEISTREGYSDEIYAKYAVQKLRKHCDRIIKLLEPTRRKK